MRTIIIFAILLFCGGILQAQPFSAGKFYQMPEPDTLNLKWGDITGDGLLDVVVFSETNEVFNAFVLVQEDSLTFHTEPILAGASANLNFQLKDFNHDGKLDMIYSDTLNGQFVFALNKGGLTFDLVELDFVMGEFLINDIDHDGDEDIIASTPLDADQSGIFWINNDTSFVEMNKISEAILTEGKYFVANEKLYAIIRNAHTEVFDLVMLYPNDSVIVLDEIHEFSSFQTMDQGDLNHDGLVDFVMSTNEGLMLYYQTESGFEKDTLAEPGTFLAELSVGDFDLDGLADILVTNTDKLSGQSVLFQNNEAGEWLADSSFLPKNTGFMNIPADINDDGDLDVLSLTLQNDSIQFIVQLNQTTTINKGPEPVYIQPPLTVYNETFLSWYKTNDDYTADPAISYELFIQEESGGYHTMPGYDMDTTTRDGFRKVVGHGYQWFDTTYTVHSLEDGRYYWGVVGVDNAYYASANIRNCVGGGGPCFDYYTVLNCFDLVVEDTTVCFNSTITIDLDRGSDSINWFSVKHGFLEKSPILNYRAIESDTIYAIHYPKIPCGEESDLCVLNYSMAIEVEKRETNLVDEYSICPGSENLIVVDGEWDSVRWWCDEMIMARGSEIMLDSIPELPMVVEAFDSLQCSVFDTLQLIYPERTFDPGSVPNIITTCTGQAIQLTFFENINTENLAFAWSPPELFDDPGLPDPYITALEEGTVNVIITENSCFVDTLDFELNLSTPPVVTTNGDQEIFRGEKVLLQAEGAITYTWRPQEGLQSPNANTTWAEPTETMRYTVHGTDSSACFAEASLVITVKKSVYIPDLFSPNGDGRNDYLHVYGESISQLAFKVFDERGSLLCELDEAANAHGWDGAIAGNELPSGTYFWTVSGQFADGQSISYQGKNKGTIRLVR